MIKLADLLADILPGSVPASFAQQDILSICVDSRQVGPGALFVALPGPQTHGGRFIAEAVRRGAKVIISENPGEGGWFDPSVLSISVPNPKEILGRVLDKFYDFPTHKVRVLGVTGTNGKTTVTYLLESVYRAWGKPCGVVGTVEHRFAGQTYPAKNTTPGQSDLYQFFAQMAAAQTTDCFMEVSSHALDQGRVSGIPFSGGIFTNLTGDHLDYHKNMEEYFLAKARLFSGLAPEAVAVINHDDVYGPRLPALTKAQVVTYGINQGAQVSARGIQLSFQGSEFLVCSPRGDFSLTTPLVGRHNIYNVLSVVAFCLFAQVPVPVIGQGISSLRGVPGRLERIEGGQDFSVFVDYAHTEDALKNVLSSLRDVSPARIILVFGCGGDRDQTKRPKMGRVGGELADEVILTNDNPRSEDPEMIVRQIVAGFSRSNYQVIFDRREALAAALARARRGDIVLIAGKGHEDYQIFKDQTVAFPERQIVREMLRARPRSC